MAHGKVQCPNRNVTTLALMNVPKECMTPTVVQFAHRAFEWALSRYDTVPAEVNAGVKETLFRMALGPLAFAYDYLKK